MPEEELEELVEGTEEDPLDLVSDDTESPRRAASQPCPNCAVLQGQVDDLNKRLGDNIRINGERLKEIQDEVNAWYENIRQWAENEIRVAREEAFAEGVKSVEDNLLPLLGVEEKAEYFDTVRRNPPKISPRPVQQQQPVPNRRVVDSSLSNLTDTATTVAAEVKRFTALGVPLSELDQSSAESVIETGSKWLASRTSTLEERISNLEGRLMRDATGATKVSTGAGVTRPAGTSALEKELQEINRQLAEARKRHQVDRAAPLLKRKREIESLLRKQQ
jgi:hypothetical protein